MFVKFVINSWWPFWRVLRRIFTGIDLDYVKLLLSIKPCFWNGDVILTIVPHFINSVILVCFQLLNFSFFFKVIVVKPFTRIFELFTVFKLKISNLFRFESAFSHFFFLLYLLTLFDLGRKLWMILIEFLKSLWVLAWGTSFLFLTDFRYKRALF